MTSEGVAPSDRRSVPRVPCEGAVRLRYRLFQEFLEENAANISSGGMFIRTIHPGEVGSELDFELRLEDDFTLIEGRGEVTWARRRGDRETPPGMGIRFVELAGDSRALVDRIVAERVAAGLELFDLEDDAPAGAAGGRPAVVMPSAAEPPFADLEEGGARRPGREPESETPAAGRAASPVPAAPGSASPAPAADKPASAAPPIQNLAALDPELPVPLASSAAAAEGSAASPRPALPTIRGGARPLRLIAVAVISALIGAGAVLAFYWLHVQPSIDALETRIDELAGRPGGPWQPPRDAPQPLPAPAAAGEATAIAVPGQVAEVTDALRRWAAAWSAQRVDDYLDFYAAGFEPPDGLDRAAWAAARRARVERPAWIRVALTLVQVEPDGADAAEVRFVQSYRAERYQDLVKKRLRMVREDGVWKIAAERLAG